jgi:DNA-binding NarL/FixJ family response regulator
MSNAPVRSVQNILIVDDDAAMEAEGVAAVAIFPDATVRTARSVGEAERWIKRVRFDLAIVDIGLPDGSGLSVIRILTQPMSNADGTDHSTVCLARTVFDDDETLFSALSAGAQGYLLKGEALSVFQTRVRAAVAGEPVVSPAIARRVLAFFRGDAGWVRSRPSAQKGPEPAALTQRETEVLKLLALGHTLNEVGAALSVSVNTVKTHVKNVYARLDVTTRVEAVDTARRMGLLRDDAR